ncbi:hypothetical protein C0583_03030 [Candidatus Parcubacteria bacterium]|nr:MAG: hypothetical protein C0583_03030 [Candidatus Parcubacteria bacterium]
MQINLRKIFIIFIFLGILFFPDSFLYASDLDEIWRDYSRSSAPTSIVSIDWDMMISVATLFIYFVASIAFIVAISKIFIGAIKYKLESANGDLANVHKTNFISGLVGLGVLLVFFTSIDYLITLFRDYTQNIL